MKSLQHKTLLLIVLLIPLVILVILSSTKKQTIPQSSQLSTTSTTSISYKPDFISTSEETKRQLGQNKTFVEVKRSDIVYSRGRGYYMFHAAPIVSEKHNLIFFTQRKVACTVWAALFRRMAGTDDWQNQNSEYRYKYRGLKYLYHYDIKTASNMMNSPLWTKAMFVRDPKERFVSAYFHKVVHSNYALRYCKKEIQPGMRVKSFSDFVNLTRVCNDAHWGLQSTRMDAQFLPLLDFVGHMENVYEDAKALLKQVGAWEEFGKLGWGANGTEEIFQSKSGLTHGAKYDEMEQLMKLLQKEYAPLMEELEERFAPDYATPQFHFNSTVSQFN